MIILGAISKEHSSDNLSGVGGESLVKILPLFFVPFLFKLIFFILILPPHGSLSAGGETHARANPMEADSKKCFLRATCV